MPDPRPSWVGRAGGVGRPSGARLAVTLGDPRGIGPEVAGKALAAVGGCVEAAWVVGPPDEARAVSRAAAASPGGPGRVEAEPVGGGVPVRRGVGDHPGRAAGRAIERAVEMALAGDVDAVVTAPVHKPALLEAGYPPGHTEMLMELADSAEVGMLMCDEGGPGSDRAGSEARPSPLSPRRVLLATIHIPLADVPKSLNHDLLVSQTRLLGRALRSDWEIAAPRIALCALNPHASDQGMFGTEERDVYAPALAKLRADPWLVDGPVPADTVFVRAFRGEFDAVVAPYHDVGMAAFKTAAFGRGVNVTLGLPFVRTSPDHGTAFDIAGQGVADPSSMAQAIRLAVRLAQSRRRPR